MCQALCLDYNNIQKFIFLPVESGEKIGTNQYKNKDTYKLHWVNATKTSYMEHTWKYIVSEWPWHRQRDQGEYSA